MSAFAIVLNVEQFLTRCSSQCHTENLGLFEKKIIKHFYKEIKLVMAFVNEDVLKSLQKLVVTCEPINSCS